MYFFLSVFFFSVIELLLVGVWGREIFFVIKLCEVWEIEEFRNFLLMVRFDFSFIMGFLYLFSVI